MLRVLYRHSTGVFLQGQICCERLLGTLSPRRFDENFPYKDSSGKSSDLKTGLTASSPVE